MLTKLQRLVLFSVLAAPNGGALASDLRPAPTKADRDALVRAGLLRVEPRGRGLWLEVTDRGWRWAQENLGAELPSNARSLQAWLARLGAYLAAKNVALADFMSARPAAPDLRRAYLALTEGALNRRVRLADLRDSFCASDRAALDEALRRAHGCDGLHLSGSDNPPELNEADRAAALDYKGEPMHFVWIAQ